MPQSRMNEDPAKRPFLAAEISCPDRLPRPGDTPKVAMAASLVAPERVERISRSTRPIADKRRGTAGFRAFRKYAVDRQNRTSLTMRSFRSPKIGELQPRAP